MQGKTVFITGAARGIGLAMAQAFAEQGANVVISDKNEQLLEEAVAQYPSLTSYICDVTEEQAIREAIDFTINKLVLKTANKKVALHLFCDESATRFLAYKILLYNRFNW